MTATLFPILSAIIIVITIIYKLYYLYQKRQIITSVTSLSRGESSERDLVYLYIPNKNGHTQIDLVVPTSVGIFVFEIKDYSGWIFGNANHNKWTQVLAYGQEKHQFYNPIKQNEGHISALRNSTEQLKNVPMYSIIVFYGSNEVKKLSNVPANCWVVYPNEAVKLVKHIVDSTPPAIFTDKWDIMRILKSAVMNGNDDTIRFEHRQKVQSVNLNKYESTYSYTPRFTGFNRRRRYF